MKKIYLSFCLLIGTQLVSAQILDTIVRHAANKFQLKGSFSGFSIGVSNNGQNFFYHFGSTKKGSDSPPNNSTIYEIGSVTKTFTSFLLAQAVIEHKAKLSDDIRRHLTGKYPNLQFKVKPVQLFQLANLTSGLPNNLPEKMPAFKSINVDRQLWKFLN